MLGLQELRELKGIGNQSWLAPIGIVADATVPVEDHQCVAWIPTAVTTPLDVIDAVKPKPAPVEQARALDGSKRWRSLTGHRGERYSKAWQNARKPFTAPYKQKSRGLSKFDAMNCEAQPAVHSFRLEVSSSV